MKSGARDSTNTILTQLFHASFGSSSTSAGGFAGTARRPSATAIASSASVITATRRLARLDETAALVTSPFLHGFLPPAYLTPLENDETAALLARGGFSDSAVTAIAEKTGNQPFLVQLIASRLFENKDLENALKFYEKVLAYQDSPVFGFALYKKGWVYYNQTDFKNAMATFIDVIDFASKGRPGKPKGDPQLLKEARKDLVRTYAQVGTPEKAWPFFQKYGKDLSLIHISEPTRPY